MEVEQRGMQIARADNGFTVALKLAYMKYFAYMRYIMALGSAEKKEDIF